MKKFALSLLALSCVCSDVANAVPNTNWTGFYIGANAGYYWGQSNSLNTNSSIFYINPLDLDGATNVANALNEIATNRTSQNHNDFIGGGQIGFSYEYNQIVFGIDADLDGLGHTNSSAKIEKFVPLVDFPESYTSVFSVSKKINYLGTVRGRIGFLWSPSLLFYGIGGLAYGGVEFNESFTAQESFSTFAYPQIQVNNNYNQTRLGWTLGVGLEWMFTCQWSAKLEYAYYDLGTLTKNYPVTQFNNLEIPAAPWATVNIHSTAQFALSAVRLGINYHF